MSKKQGLVIGLLSVVLLLLISFVGMQAYQDKKKPQVLKVGVILYRREDEFISSLSRELEKEIKKIEERYHQKINIKIVDSRNDQSLQNSQVDNFIRNDYDVIAVNMVDRTVSSMIINRGKQADIPIIFFNREPVAEDINIWEKVYYVGTHAKEAGTMAGDIVVTNYFNQPDALDRNGDHKLQYVMLEGEEDHQDAMLRTEATVAAIVNQGIELEKLDWAIADWMRPLAYENMKKWIGLYGDDIELVLSNNDEMALGAIEAMKEMNVEPLPFIVGIDGTAGALESIERGQLSGTVMNDRVTQARGIGILSYALGNHLDPKDYLPELEGKYLWVPHQMVNKVTIE